MGNELTTEYSTSSSDFRPGDKVKVTNDLQTFKVLQLGHGGFVPAMENILGEEGNVLTVDRRGNLHVRYGSRMWVVNPASCTLVSRGADSSHQQTSSFQVGDKVRCGVNKEELEKRQKFHGGWNPEMVNILGKEGIVLKVDGDGDLFVHFRYRAWFLNPASCTLVSKGSERSRQYPLSLKVGDKVLCDVEKEEFEKLQEFHGGWIPDMKNVIGKEGVVIEISGRGSVVVVFDDDFWELNALCCKRIPPPGEEDESHETRVKTVVPETSASATGGATASTPEESGSDFKQQFERLVKRVEALELGNICPECKERPKRLLFQCGHGTCKKCGATLDMCPLCHAAIEKKIMMVD